MRAAGLASSAALVLVLFGGCEEQAGSAGQGVGPVTGGDAAEDRGVETTLSLPDADSLGIAGWQEASYPGRGERSGLRDGALSLGPAALKSLADTRPGLSVVSDKHGRHRLTGLVEPGDAGAIMGALASAEVRASKMSSVPPTSEIRSLGEMAAAAVQLVSVEPSAASLVGAGADPEVARRLERAARAWPTDARVWRIIGLPPDADEGSSVRFMPDNDPENDHDESRHRRLQAMGILEFTPVEGGGTGDLVAASVGFPYQNQELHDREFSVRFLYDRGTDRWVLYSIRSFPSRATMQRLARAGEMNRIEGMAHELDLLSVLPDCHLVVGRDGPLLCK